MAQSDREKWDRKFAEEESERWFRMRVSRRNEKKRKQSHNINRKRE